MGEKQEKELYMKFDGENEYVKVSDVKSYINIVVDTGIRWFDVREILPEKGGKYLVVRHREHSNPQYDILYFTKDSGGLYNTNEVISKKDKNLWYYYDSEFGDIIVKDVKCWALLCGAERVMECACKKS